MPVVKPNTLHKRISFAPPNNEKTGWHVEVTNMNVDGTGERRTYIPDGAKTYKEMLDPKLIKAFQDAEGTICPRFARHSPGVLIDAINGKKVTPTVSIRGSKIRDLPAGKNKRKQSKAASAKK